MNYPTISDILEEINLENGSNYKIEVYNYILSLLNGDNIE